MRTDEGKPAFPTRYPVENTNRFFFPTTRKRACVDAKSLCTRTPSRGIARIKGRFKVSLDDNTLMTFRGHDNENNGTKKNCKRTPSTSSFFSSVAFINRLLFRDAIGYILTIFYIFRWRDFKQKYFNLSHFYNIYNSS